MNACLHTATQKPGKGGKKHTHTALCRRSPNSSHEKEEKRGEEEDLKSVAGREIDGTAQHKSRNKVSSLLSGAANVTVVSSRYKCQIKHD